MTERKNIKLPESLFLALRDDKPDHMSWPTYFETTCLADDAGGVDTKQLDRIEAAVEEATEAAQSAQKSVDELKR